MKNNLGDVNPFLSEFQTPHKSIPFDKINDEHFIPAYNEAFTQLNNEIQRIITSNEEPSFFNTIVPLEESGHLLAILNNTLFNLDAANTTKNLQAIIEQTVPRITALENDIMLNEELFSKIKIVNDTTNREDLTPEQNTLLNNTYSSFVRNGALLSDENKSTFRSITEKLAMLSVSFGNNLLEDTNNFQLIVSKQKDLAGLPPEIITAAEEKAKLRGVNGWLFDLSAPSFNSFMQHADNRNFREKLYKAFHSRGNRKNEFNNNSIVKEMVSLRLQKAKLLGYKTYADLVLEKRMAKSSHNVYKLLNNLKKAYKAKAQKEYQEVDSHALKLGFEGKLMPWDFSYYSDKLKQEKFQFSEKVLKPYLNLNSVRKGVFDLAKKLYGISFNLKKEIPIYHEEVEAYEVIDRDKSFLGILYVDFHPRESKQGGAWMTNYMEQKGNSRPHVSIVMNFSPPTNESPSLLTFREVETFLHEFGHALHGLFSKTTYSSLSGTNVYRDFVELPSQIMENWATEKGFLDSFARHYKTGELIPEELIDKIKESRNFLVAYNCMRQLNFAYLDMAWHTIEEDKDFPIQTFELESLRDTQILPFIDGMSISTQLSHIFSGGYAAGYYSYKWAEVLDADAFDVFDKFGVFNKKCAQSFRVNILEKGGTIDPDELYLKFRKKKPKIQHLMERDQIIEKYI